MVVLLFALMGSISAFSQPVQNSDRLYDNASDGSPLISLIHSAKQNIDVEIYTMKDTKVIKELKAAMNRGVHLRIIQTPNPVGDPCPIFQANDASTPADCQALRAFVPYVKSHGGQYEPFSFELCGDPSRSCFEHGKMLIVDNNTVMISTGNFDPTNLCDLSESPLQCNRDFSVVLTDAKSVNAYITIFEKDLIGSAYDLSSILASAPQVTASPLSMKPLVDFINSAQRTLQIENQYLNDPTMNAAIISAAKRKVKVFIMVSSVSAFGRLDPSRDAGEISRWDSNFQAFDQAGVNSRIFDDEMKINRQPGYLHAKTILVDGVHAWVGSVNGSTQSLSYNREFGYFSDDKAFVKHLGEVMYADFTNHNAESWSQSLNCKKDSCDAPATDPILHKGPGEHACAEALSW